MTTPDLGALERNAFRNLFIDGLIDIGLGLWLVLFSVLIVSDYAAFGGVALVLVLPIWERLRRRITIPRVGEVRQRERPKNLRLALIILILFLTLALGILLAVTRGSGPRGLEDFFARSPHLLLGMVLAFLVACIGAIFRVPRWLAYSASILVLLVAGPRLGFQFPASLAAAGILVVVTGSLVLANFLRAFPVEPAAIDGD